MSESVFFKKGGEIRFSRATGGGGRANQRSLGEEGENTSVEEGLSRRDLCVPERLASLSTRVVKLARLADDDGSSTDDHDLLDVSALLRVGRLVPGAEDGRLRIFGHGAHGTGAVGTNVLALGVGHHPGGLGNAQGVR